MRGTKVKILKKLTRELYKFRKLTSSEWRAIKKKHGKGKPIPKLEEL